MNFAFYNENRPVTGRSVLWWVISFFAVIFIANFFFVFFALSSWTGLSTENAYEKGLRYNETIARAEAQNRLGWQSSTELNAKGLLTVKLKDKSGDVLLGRIVRIHLMRPGHQDFDQEIALPEVAQGVYQATVDFPKAGRWWADVSVGEQYRKRHELDVK